MLTQVILAIDQGTTNSKAILVDINGAIISRGSSPVQINHPKPGWVEQNPMQIWDSVQKAIVQCLAQVSDVQILSIGISNQRESVTAWHRQTGIPLSDMLTWQCSRTSAACESLKSKNLEQLISGKTGLPISPLFPSTKISWILEEISSWDASPSLDDICIGTVDSWLIWQLTDGAVHACDRSNAARTQLFNIQDCCWDDELCNLFKVNKTTLPEVMNSQDNFGQTRGLKILPDGIKISSAIGDSHAALFGHRAFNVGDGKITFGTGSSVMTLIPEFTAPQNGLTTTIAWSINGKSTYAFEGNILVSASAFPWAVEVLGLDNVTTLIDLAQATPDSQGVSFVPAFVGLGSPHWKPEARGVFTGLSFNSQRAHFARAVAESLALQVYDVFEALLKQLPSGIGQIFVDGGPSESQFLMSLVAGYIEHQIIMYESSEASAMGAAYLAGLQAGMWKDIYEIQSLSRPCNLIDYEMDKNLRLDSIRQWQHAVQSSSTIVE